MGLLSQNSKMKSSSKGKYLVYDLALPAIKTCPFAGRCKDFCYAKQGTYCFTNVKNKHEDNLKRTLSNSFIDDLKIELIELKRKALKANKKLVVRLHSSGDFYSQAYTDKIMQIIKWDKSILYYAYTKSIPYFLDKKLPANFRTIYSQGGTHDNLIKPNDRHSRVFNNAKEAKDAGYFVMGDDDIQAVLSKNPKIGLIIHGNKKMKV